MIIIKSKYLSPASAFNLPMLGQTLGLRTLLGGCLCSNAIEKHPIRPKKLLTYVSWLRVAGSLGWISRCRRVVHWWVVLDTTSRAVVCELAKRLSGLGLGLGAVAENIIAIVRGFFLAATLFNCYRQRPPPHRNPVLLAQLVPPASGDSNPPRTFASSWTRMHP